MNTDLRTPIPERIRQLIRNEAEPTSDDILCIIVLRHELQVERSNSPLLITAKIDYLMGELERVTDKFQQKHEWMFT